MWQGVLSKVFKMRDKFALNLGGDDEEKPFIEHLEDLRKMIVRMGLTILITVFGTFIFHKELFYLIKLPLLTAGIVSTMADTINYLRSNGPAEAFMAMVNISLISAIIVAFPILLLFLLQFILPGLKDNERKLIFPAIAIGAGLFIVGVAFSYSVVLPKALYFFEEFGRSLGIRQDWTLSDYVTFSTRFVLVFGIAFELPVIVMALVKLDILNFKLMMNTWRYALIGIMLFAAIITPTPDVLTLLLMSGPLYVLYGICVALAYFMEKKDRAANPEYYAELAKDEAELEKEIATDDWDKEDYNPWSTADEDDDDDESYGRKPKPTPESATDDAASPKPESAPEPAAEKTLEDFAREDQEAEDPNDENRRTGG
jgi:Tat protein translocase TatC